MTETITLDTRKCESTVGNARIAPLRRGERGNVPLVVFVRRNLRPYDLTGMTAYLVWKAADGKLVGPVPMEVTDPATGIVRCTLPDACYSTVGTARAYVELRRGAELVDTTDELGVKVLDCIDADGEQAEEYKPLIAEVREATDAAIKAAADATAAADKANEATVAATNAATKANEVEAKLTGNILKGKAKDTFVHVEDAFPSTLLGIDIEGACKQEGIPSPDAPKPITVIEHPTVKVAGRNLWPFSSSYTSIEGHQNEFVNNKTPFTILPGTYTFSAAGSLGNTDAPLFGYTATGKRIELFRIMRNVTNPKYSFTVTEPVVSVYFISNAADSNTGTISSIQLELGSIATEYVPHTSQSLTFTLPAEHPYLAKLPDGTADEIVVDRNGNVSLMARVAKAKVPDNTTWSIQENKGYSLGYSGLALRANGVKKNVFDAIICEKYQASQTFKNAPCIGITDVLWIVPRTNSGDITAQELAKAANGMTFYAPLAEEARYQIGRIEMPKAQDSIVNAWTDAEVTPNTGIEYTRDVNIVISNLESAIASITEG